MCSVKFCGTNTKTSSAQKDGISFHKFPRQPEAAARWAEATGRVKWSPKTGSLVCSRHFASDCYNVCPYTQKRRLMKDAMPTLHLPLLPVIIKSEHSQPGDDSTQTIETVPNVSKRIRLDLSSPIDDHQTKQQLQRIQKQSCVITKKNQTIKMLRERLRRAEKKITRLEATVKELKDTGVIINITESNHYKKEVIEPSDIVMERKSIHIIRL